MDLIISRKTFSILWLLFLICIPIISYSAKDKPVVKTFVELKQLSEKIGQKQYSTDINLVLYTDEKSIVPIESKQMRIAVWNNYVHYKTEILETYANNEMVITINHKKKIILINKNYINSNSKSLTQNLLPFSLDTTQSKMYKIALLKTEEQLKTFEFKNQIEGNKINKMVFKIDSKETKPVTCEMYYAENLSELLGKYKKEKSNKAPRMLFEFKNFIYSSKFNAKDFDFSEVLIIEKANQIKLAASYKNYELVNNILKRK